MFFLLRPGVVTQNSLMQPTSAELCSQNSNETKKCTYAYHSIVTAMMKSFAVLCLFGVIVITGEFCFAKKIKALFPH